MPAADPKPLRNWPRFGEPLRRGVVKSLVDSTVIMGLSLNYVARCVIDERTEGRILGHNDAIREQLDAAGWPPACTARGKACSLKLGRRSSYPDGSDRQCCDEWTWA